MSMTFTKLFSSITASTIWAAPDPTRIVWITMLAMADQHGRVWASIPGLANIARVSIEACESALSELMGPDKYSRTKDNEGRRVEEIDGGWRLLNHAKYRAIRDDESIRESKRRYINARREKERAAGSTVEGVEQSRTAVDRCRANTEAEAEAEIHNPPTPSGVAPPKPEKSPKGSKRCPESFAVDADTARSMRDEFPGVDIDAETRKFRDHTFSTARTDWMATWRNWIRGAAERIPQARASPPRVSAAAMAMAAANPSIAAPHLRPQQPTFEVFDVSAVRLD